MGIGTKRTQQRCVIDTWIWTDDWLIWSASCFFWKSIKKQTVWHSKIFIPNICFVVFILCSKKIHLYFGDGVMNVIDFTIFYETFSGLMTWTCIWGWFEVGFFRTKTIKQFGSKFFIRIGWSLRIPCHCVLKHQVKPLDDDGLMDDGWQHMPFWSYTVRISVISAKLTKQCWAFFVLSGKLLKRTFIQFKWVNQHFPEEKPNEIISLPTDLCFSSLLSTAAACDARKSYV